MGRYSLVAYEPNGRRLEDGKSEVVSVRQAQPAEQRDASLLTAVGEMKAAKSSSSSCSRNEKFVCRYSRVPSREQTNRLADDTATSDLIRLKSLTTAATGGGCECDGMAE